ncbi:MAG: sensor histidine kinase [Polyangiaceae bacterium]|nr:sensor histidine kinase [Polyangiaceae bacterium]
MAEPPDLDPPPRVGLAEPGPFLATISRRPWFHHDLDNFDTVEMWALVALCALSRKERPDDIRCDVYERGSSRAGRFAHAVRFTEARDAEAAMASQTDRTVAIQRVRFGQPTAKVAEEIASLAVPGADEVDSRDALAYVIDELLRNVIQHSGDALGAVVGAQRMDAGKGGYRRATVQVAVADTGKGIWESLKIHHEVPSAEVALEKAIRPHVSGTFPEGQTGSLNNAGLGLFFTSEMAKLTRSRFLLASRGASLLLSSDEEADTHAIEILVPPGTGFPGTLAVFELPLEIVDRDALLDVIRKRASERTPASSGRTWLTYEAPPAAVPRVLVRELLDDTTTFEARVESYRAGLSAGRPLSLDFSGIAILTQSVLHALLFHSVRVAWAMGTKVYIECASPAVRSGLDYLESYALK